MNAEVEIYAGEATDDPVVADHFGNMWRDSPVPGSALVDDWFERTMAFIAAARASGTFLSYLARCDGEIAGSLAAQQFAGLYPDVLRHEYRRHAYVWGVFVCPVDRRKGIASALMRRSLEDMKGLGYSRVLLHASEMGNPVYKALGFDATNELKLDLVA
ncbi:MAG: GNAT family N-acetyltransferase [Alphaproteobacteria bacterium]